MVIDVLSATAWNRKMASSTVERSVCLVMLSMRRVVLGFSRPTRCFKFLKVKNRMDWDITTATANITEVPADDMFVCKIPFQNILNTQCLCRFYNNCCKNYFHVYLRVFILIPPPGGSWNFCITECFSNPLNKSSTNFPDFLKNGYGCTKMGSFNYGYPVYFSIVNIYKK